jgi:hypothetical protein
VPRASEQLTPARQTSTARSEKPAHDPIETILDRPRRLSINIIET